VPTISGLGHVGLYCFDLAAQERFYTEVLGLTKTDEDRELGMVFLSAQPDQEHHERSSSPAAGATTPRSSSRSRSAAPR
jgi:catechol 2,3-dioxygenase-like lactoylglutathione lyase family enzyme